MPEQYLATAVAVDLSTVSNNIGWLVAGIGGLITLAILIRKAGRWVRAVFKKGNAVIDTLVGRDAIYHPETGKELVPASAGIGPRLSTQEEQMVLLTAAVTKIADSHGRLEHAEGSIADHETRLGEVEGKVEELVQSRIERVITRAESTQAWQTMEAAIKAQPDEDIELGPGS